MDNDGKCDSHDTSSTHDMRGTKDRGWYTAFYRYAEYLRLLTQGALNHKSLYAYVGLNGRYVNNENPTMRKRSAGGLSRLLHSSRYADDFCQSLSVHPGVFREAAEGLACDLRQETALDQARLVDLLLSEGYSQLRAGLAAEISAGRLDVQITRLDGEIELFRTWAHEQLQYDAQECLHVVLWSFFYIMAFGHLEENFANSLVDACPTDILREPDDAERPQSMRACIMRAADDNPASIENMWAVGEEDTFLIGRYVNCDAVDTCSFVSRRHCLIFRSGDVWYVRDEGSRYGTAVHRGGSMVWESGKAAASDAASAGAGGVGAVAAGDAGTAGADAAGAAGTRAVDADVGAAGAGAVGAAATAAVAALPVSHVVSSTDFAPIPADGDCFPLKFGDCVVLAGCARYWFVSLQNVERLLVG